MKDRILIADLNQHIDQEVAICAWTDTRRDQGKMVFFEFRDRTGKVQGVTLPNSPAMEIAKTLRSEWVVKVTGKVNKRPERNIQADKINGDIELEVLGVEVLSEAHELPFNSTADLNLDTLLDNRPLTLRRPREQAIFKVQSEILGSFREFLTKENFTEFRAPAIVGGDAEGGTEVFKFDYFYGKTAYLGTSPQLYKQMMVGVFERVFTVANVFRAEKHATARHLNEYTSLDIEMGFIDGPEDVMKMESRLLKYVTEHLKKVCSKEFELLGAEFPLIPEGDMFPAMKLTDAQKLISDATGVDCTQEPDLDPEHERWLCEYSKKEFGSDFIFITNYPRTKRPFYAMDDENVPGRTKCYDLLFRGLELISGNQREHRYEKLVEKMKWKGLDPEKFSFYLQAFKYGLPPHGGLGMGLERLTARFLNIPNIKEATLFPRDINRIDQLLSKDNDTQK
ncbi:MAG: aspartyl-tRNA synthetase, archaeal type [Patescibacteria group bacterium]|nr:aspartyl-tRNA synthetase, archaeal type [Patescibacteria group bacterium]